MTYLIFCYLIHYEKNESQLLFYKYPVIDNDIITVTNHLKSKTSSDCDALSIKLIKLFINNKAKQH